LNYDEVDIRLTRKYKKVIARRSWFDLIYDVLINLTLSFIYPFASFLYVYGKLDRGEVVSIGAIVNLFLSTVFAFLLLYAWSNTTKLKKVEGLERSKNREIIMRIIEKNKWVERRKTKTLVIASPPFGFQAFNWGRQYNFLLDENHIYVNVISFGRFQISHFHWFADRYMERRIFKEIKDCIRNDTLP
jgi:hypothetical protein